MSTIRGRRAVVAFLAAGLGAALASAASGTGSPKVSALPGLAHSDAYRDHGALFARAAADLIAAGRCGPEDFQETGGFYQAELGTFFAYCGTARIDNRVFIQVSGDAYSIP